MPILVTVVCVCVCVLKLRAKDFFFLISCVGLCQHTFLVCSQTHAEAQPFGWVDERSLERTAASSCTLRRPQGLSFSVRKERQCRVFAFSPPSPLAHLLYLHKCKSNSTGQNTQGRERGILETRTRCRIVFLTLFSSWYFFSFVFLA